MSVSLYNTIEPFHTKKLVIRRNPNMKEKKKKAPSRRNDVVRCPKCGEDYSITYKRCPFCEERPGRLGVAGSSNSHPIQLLMTILCSLFLNTSPP